MKIAAHRVFAVALIFCGLLASRADTAYDHQVAQERPIQLGTSGGNFKDRSRHYCCSGTLGALVQDQKGRLFILSNNHVLARTNRGQKYERISQPGAIDEGCRLQANAAVARLTKRIRIRFGSHAQNVMDAAIARVLHGRVDPGGSILGIGMVEAGTIEPSVGLAVKKSGRTTGVTHGVISAVEVSIEVTYNRRCGVGSRTALFLHQIRISPGNFGDFGQGGDSGSLVVEDTDNCPRVVGLLFAGGGDDIFANPIGPILSEFNLTIVGCDGSSNLSSTAFASAAPLQRGGMASSKFLACKAVKEAAESTLLSVPGVVGTGVGLSDSASGGAAVEVYTTEDPAEIRKRLPAVLNSAPLKIIRTGTIHAL
ncbi:MAG TPA: hypothetical protein VL171_13350 [Verrucomicrobiae bacterium]|nr:hypothetical protein [Verrucomicrobiae bacterium]